MAIDLLVKTKKELENLITNYEKINKTQDPFYLEILASYNNKTSDGLIIEKSKDVVLQAARDGRFVAYSDLEKASGISWSKAYRGLSSHLWVLAKYGYDSGIGMLTAIIVNGKNVESGRLEPDALKGFMQAASDLAIETDLSNKEFLRSQQSFVFQQARGAAA